MSKKISINDLLEKISGRQINDKCSNIVQGISDLLSEGHSVETIKDVLNIQLNTLIEFERYKEPKNLYSIEKNKDKIIELLRLS